MGGRGRGRAGLQGLREQVGIRSRILCGAVRHCEDPEPLPRQQKPLEGRMNGRVGAGNPLGRWEERPAAHFASCTGYLLSRGGEIAARSRQGQSGAHQRRGAHYVPGLMQRVSASESQRNCWMHCDLFGLGSAERMADIGKNAGLFSSCRQFI